MSRYREIPLGDGQILFSDGDSHPSIRENTLVVGQSSGYVGQIEIPLS